MLSGFSDPSVLENVLPMMNSSESEKVRGMRKNIR